MKRILPVALGLALASSAASAADMTEEQKTLYAIGQLMARQTAVFRLSAEELDHVQQGWRDATLNATPAVDLAQYTQKVNELARERAAISARETAAKGKAVVDAAAAEKGAVKGPSGFVYLPLTEGTGAQPEPSDTVRVNYRGTLPDGTEFDSSYKRNEPAEFPLNGVIRCWTQGVAMMKVGGKARLTCPADTAYGDRSPSPLIPAGSTLVFEIELLEVKGK